MMDPGGNKNPEGTASKGHLPASVDDRKAFLRCLTGKTGMTLRERSGLMIVQGIAGRVSPEPERGGRLSHLTRERRNIMRGNWEPRLELTGRRGWGVWTSVAVVAALLAAVGLTPAASADDAAGSGARGVRLSDLAGQVQLSVGGQVIADQALANAPLFEGTRVVTGGDGRAEVQFEDGSVARLSPDSSFTITVLKGDGTSGEAEVTLEEGLGYFELQGNGQAGAIRVKFGDSTVTATGFTVLRINMDDLPGQLAVFSGSVHLVNPTAGVVDVHGGQSLTLKGRDGRYALADTIEPDSWDTWNADRDQALNLLAATQTSATNGMADSSNPAWSDLNANGSWYNVPGQGQVWSPYEASSPGWDPYGNGYWMWTPRFGYMWVSDNTWGYMPYSCGMWNWYDGFGWGWGPAIGGCSPWWNGGGYLMNVGGYPGWWNAPIPPRSPHRPPGPPPGPPHGRPLPVVAVSRHLSAPANTVLPARDLGVPVVLAGHTVIPLHPLSARPEYGQVSTSGSGLRAPVAFGVPGSAVRAVPYSGGNSRTATAGAGRTTTYSSASHPSSSGARSAASASRGSSSGGYVSSGGGGGGHAGSGGSSGGGHK